MIKYTLKNAGGTKMFFRILALFIIIPILELVILLKLGNVIGIGYTLFIIILTGVIGVWLAKSQGFIVLSQFRQSLEYGYMPGDSIVEGILILLGGAVLLTPGLITDTIGFMLLIPFTRKLIREMLKNRLRYYFNNGHFKIFIR
jgi:UPF0716 protein FxsA